MTRRLPRVTRTALVPQSELARARRYFVADPEILRHLIANAVLLLSALAFGFYLDRFGLLTRSAGAVFGAGYSSQHPDLGP
jgi:uncharacterized membrane protein (UPF0182 family)